MPSQYGLGENKPLKSLRWLYLPFMLLLALGCMALATQRIAAFWSYQPALGDPWFFAFGRPWYAPWSVFAWKSRFVAHDAYGFMEQAVIHSQMLFLFPQFIILGVWLCFAKKLRSNASLHGSARWANESEIRRMGYLEGKGVYVGGWVKKYAGLALLLRIPAKTFDVFTGSGDVPDDWALRLVVLPPDAAFSKSGQSLAIERAREVLKKRGDQPLFKQNRLIFVAADYDSVSRLKDHVRSHLAWRSIVDDYKNNRIVLDNLMAK